ncbi:MAG: hypothetical protein LBJ20_02275 [Candidatus Methanoplasma sp.]|nr:hypothetical protein [Candidatus Methanoplasma sp.]
MSANPALTLTKKCMVAFIDILGSKSILCSDDKKGVEEYVRGIRGFNDMIYDEFPSFHIRTFSDNILIYTDDCSESSIMAMINSVAHLQYEVLCQFKLLMRGGIVIDDLHWIDDDEDFITGRSIVRAHRIEESKAKNPRIMMSKKDFSDMRFYMAPCEYGDCVAKDKDGFLFVNYLQTTMNEGFPNEELIEKHARAIISHTKADTEKRGENKEKRERIMMKDVWTLEYHNGFCSANDIPLEISYDLDGGENIIMFAEDVSADKKG